MKVVESTIFFFSFYPRETRVAQRVFHSFFSFFFLGLKKRGCAGRQGRKVHSFKSKKNSHKTSRVLKRALEMKAKPLSRTCGKCKVLKTQKKWYKGDTCGSCYRSAKAEAENKRCSKCQETKASAWYKSKEESKEDEDLCSRCYQKQRTLLAEHTCIGCQITQSTSWYKVETLLDGYRNGIEHLFRRSQRFAQQARGLNAGRGLRVITGQAQEQFCSLFGVAASK